MAHVAIVDSTDTVINVIVVNNEALPNEGEFSEHTELAASSFVDSIGLLPDGCHAFLTSYNKKFRFNYASIGGKFVRSAGGHGAFVDPKPFPSWTLDSYFKWQPPTPQPGPEYFWDEESQQWQTIPVGD